MRQRTVMSELSKERNVKVMLLSGDVGARLSNYWAHL